MKTHRTFLLIAAAALMSLSARSELVDPGYGHQQDNFNAGSFFDSMSRPDRSGSEAAIARSVRLPAALIQRVTDYLGSKLALQAAWQKEIAKPNQGTDTGDTLKAFQNANRDRIVALMTEREAIRAELTKFVTQTKPRIDPALDRILRAFDVDQGKS